MGLFDKRSAEEKAFDKALSGAYSKPNAKNFEVLEGTLAAWPTGWRGYFYMSMAYEVGSGVEFNPEKGKAYREKAIEAANLAADTEPIAIQWLNNFYYYYDQSADCLYAQPKFESQTLKVRQAIVAFIINFVSIYRSECAVLSRKSPKADIDIWDVMLRKIPIPLFGGTDAQKQIYSQVTVYYSWRSAMGTRLVSGVNEHFKPLDDNIVRLIDHSKEQKSFDSLSSDTDLHLFIIGYCEYMAYPFSEPDNIDRISYGTQHLVNGVRMGSAPCLYFLTSLAINKTFNDNIYKYSNHFSVDEHRRELMRIAKETGDMYPFVLLEDLDAALAE